MRSLRRFILKGGGGFGYIDNFESVDVGNFCVYLGIA